jgi:hypothetical protein
VIHGCAKYVSVCVYIYIYMPTQDGMIVGFKGRAVAQAVSRWIPTVAVRVRVRAACRICG